MTNKLWAIHLPGPDDFYPAPNEAIAQHMAKHHNASMEEYLLKHPDLVDNKFGVAKESIFAVVSEWPGASESHAKRIQEFNYSVWGMKVP